MALFGLLPADVVPVATDRLQTDVQKENAARAKADLEAQDLQLAAPEMSVKEKLKLGGSAPDYSQGFAAANASNFTASLPLKV
jgi:hypothetical protein